MFGKKGNSAKSTPKAITGSAHNAPGFFMAHVEKLVFGVILLLLAGLMFEGFGAKGFDKSKTPEQLASESGDTLKQVKSENHWPEVAALDVVRTESTDFTGNASKGREKLKSEKFSLPLFQPPNKHELEKRGDPVIQAPIKVVAQTIFGAIAVIKPDTTLDPLTDLDDAPRIESKAAKSQKGKNRAGAYGGSDMGGEAGMGVSGMASGMPGMEGGMGVTAGPRRLFGKYDRGYGAGATGGYGGGGNGGAMEGGGMPGDSAGGMPGMGDASGSMGGMGGMGGLGGLGGMGGAATRPEYKNKKIVAVPVIYNVVMALVPHEEMVKEYKKKFENAGSYIPYRDRPTYTDFIAQRVEVTGNPSRKIEEGEWINLTKGAIQLNMIMKDWVNKPDPRLPPLTYIVDHTDPLSVDPSLTMVIPPFYLRNYRTACKHPDIEWSWDANMRRMLEMMPEMKPLEENPELRPGQKPAGMMGGMGMAGMGGMGMPGGGDMYGGAYGGGMGMDGGMGMASGMGMEGGMGMAGMGGMGGMGMPGGGDMYGGGMGMDGGMGMSSGMGMYGGMGMMPGGVVPKYKMVRFYDRLSPQDIGKIYRYRIQLVMDDPNYPENPSALDASQLESAAFKRVNEQRRKDEPKKKAIEEQFAKQKQKNLFSKPDYRTLRLTPWSEASDLVRVERPMDLVLGEVKPQKYLPFDSGKLQVPGAEPSAKMVVAELDMQGLAPGTLPTAAMLPMSIDKAIVRGALLGQTKKEIEVVHPVTKIVKLVKSPKPIQTSATVVDIRGAESLSNSAADDPLTDAGEMMVITSDGSVTVLNEWDDMFHYRMYLFSDEKEAAEKGTGMGMGGMEGEMGMGAGMPGS